MKPDHLFCLLLMLMCLTTSALCQEEESEPEESESPHSIALMVGYAFVPQTIADEEVNRVIPTIGIDYSYFFSHKMAIGVVNDLEFAKYFVRDPRSSDSNGVLERDNKYIGALVFIYEPKPWIALYAGPGIEVDKHESFALFKVGFELAKRFEQGWGVGISTSIDFNEIYQTISTGVIISKRIP